ncbi:N-acetylmuramoyl-L-alanine amidase [Novosphingobium sp. FKTRR1]|uniref:N-acetylmuramoyl-L-alanine amidase family protein n=1 Tax=unclassified Novosphingobium TaxID=2644732 RepID=UPI001CEFB60F|nr:N-acetylmuramoyl-L-alanine amidase [Novosphingobium sp. FKTRR1]
MVDHAMGLWARIGWALVVTGFVVPAAAVLAMWQSLGAGASRSPAYVVHLALPGGERPIGLPVVLGPADASRPLVVIDAGHGGHDPGASGPRGEKEKALTLGLALALRDALLADGRLRVALTRSDDRFLALEERAGIASRLHADLFLSIHADAAGASDAEGATVYTLSDKGSDALADQLAARENRADTINGIALGGKSDAVSSILVDLSQRAMRARSRAVSALIVREGGGALRFHRTPEREAAFVVLKSVDLPSLLLEAGYVSNPDDARAMADPAWRRAFGKALARAITIALAQGEGAQTLP